jgi:CBS domain-containing protein
MKTIRQILQAKTKPLVHIAPDATVYEALSLMAKHDVGAVVVLDGTRMVGIFSERDYARKLALQGKGSHETKVREIMTEKVFYVPPETTVDECMAIMTQKRFRHLPVLDKEERVLGLVSIGDMVHATISEQQFIIEQLEHYITGSH